VNSGYRILEHPADLGIEARGRTLNEAFEQAAAGLISVLIDPAGIGARQEIVVEVEAPDRERLLVCWLGELLYQLDGRGFVPASCSVSLEGETRLRALVRGEQLDLDRHTTRTDVKAITYHQLAVRKTPQGFMLTVFLDI